MDKSSCYDLVARPLPMDYSTHIPITGLSSTKEPSKMKPSQYLDRVRAALGAPSDYALQKPLQLSKQQIGRYRKDLDFFSDEVAMRVAYILREDAGIVMLDMHRERAKTPEVRSKWDEIFSGFPALLLHAKSVRRHALPR